MFVPRKITLEKTLTLPNALKSINNYNIRTSRVCKNINICLVNLGNIGKSLMKHDTVGLSGEGDGYNIFVMSLRLGLEEC